MKIKLDENLPADLADDLRALGHDAHTVHGQGLAGAADPQLLARMQTESRTFWTMDKGIANIRSYPPTSYSGIVLFRLRTTARRTVLAFIRRQLPTLLQIDPSGRLIIVTEAGIRIR